MQEMNMPVVDHVITMTEGGTITIPEGGTITIPEGGTITIPGGELGVTIPGGEQGTIPGGLLSMNRESVKIGEGMNMMPGGELMCLIADP